MAVPQTLRQAQARLVAEAHGPPNARQKDPERLATNQAFPARLSLPNLSKVVVVVFSRVAHSTLNAGMAEGEEDHLSPMELEVAVVDAVAVLRCWQQWAQRQCCFRRKNTNKRPPETSFVFLKGETFGWNVDKNISPGFGWTKYNRHNSFGLYHRRRHCFYCNRARFSL
jgi:hypothetical protein